MILNKFTGNFFCAQRFKSVSVIFLFFLSFSLATIVSASNSSNLRIEKNEPSDVNDLSIKSIGALEFKNDMAAHIDLSYLESDVIGNSVALDFGAGYVFGGATALFIGLGMSLDFNLDHDDFSDKYYYEAGVVLDVSRELSITARKQIFFNQAEEYEEIIMMGLLFRH